MKLRVAMVLLWIGLAALTFWALSQGADPLPIIIAWFGGVLSLVLFQVWDRS